MRRRKKLTAWLMCIGLFFSMQGNVLTIDAAQISNAAVTEEEPGSSSTGEEIGKSETPSAEEEAKESETPLSEKEGKEPETPSSEEEGKEPETPSSEEEGKEPETPSSEEEGKEPETPSSEEEGKEPETPSSEEEGGKLQEPSPEEEDTETEVLSEGQNVVRKPAMMRMPERENDSAGEKTVEVTQLRLIKKIDGTPDFDTDDAPGHDRSDDNGILRTFDTLTYELRAAVQVPPVSAYALRSRQTLSIPIRVLLPGIHTGQVEFLTGSMDWLQEAEVTDTEDGLELTGYALVNGQEDSAYWADFAVSMKAYKMKQGDTFAPVFEAWTKDQEERARVEEGTEVIISAKVSLNTSVSFTSVYQDGDFDFSAVPGTQNSESNTQFGRMMGLGVNFQLLSEHDDLKGIQLPEGDLTFDVDLRMLCTEGSGQPKDVTDTYAPLLWDYHQGYQEQSKTGYLGRELSEKVFPNGEIPYGKYTEEYPDNCVYDSGSLEIEQEGHTLHLTVKDYRFSDEILFPTQYQGSGNIDAKRGCFSSVWMQILMPYEQAEPGSGARIFSAQAEGKNLALDGNPETQADEKDDQASRQIQTVVGGYNQTLLFAHQGDFCADGSELWIRQQDLASATNEGDFFAYPGEELTLAAILVYRGFTSSSQPPALNGIDYLVKVPEEIELPGDLTEIKPYRVPFTPSLSDDRGRSYPLLVDPFWWDIWYVAKPDGAGWKNELEMDRAQIDDLVCYASKEEADAANAKILGVYLEGRGGKNFWDFSDRLVIEIPVTVSPDAQAEYVYPVNEEGTCYHFNQGLDRGQGIRYEEGYNSADPNWGGNQAYYAYRQWLYDQGGEDYKATGGLGGWIMDDDSELALGRYDYVKTEYQDGKVASGTHIAQYKYLYHGKEITGLGLGEFAGASLLIVDAQACIEKSVEQTGTDGKPRTVYDLSLGQRRADFVLSPSFAFAGEDSLQGRTDTLTITDTLDQGLTYQKGTAKQGGSYDPETETLTGGVVLEPEVTEDENGCQILTWTLEDVEAGKPIEKIHYSCLIGTPGEEQTDVHSGSLLKNTVTIKAPSDQRALRESNSNLATASIKVVKNRNASLNKSVDREYAELNDSLCYTIRFENPGDTSCQNLLFRDILPFTGDMRGTDLLGGSYTVTEVEILSDADCELYMTDSAKVRGEMLDETVLTDWTLLKAEDGTEKRYRIDRKADKITALAWKTTVPAGKGLTVKIYIELDCNKEKAVLYNTVGAYMDQYQQLNTPKVKTEVIARSISGLAWEDRNRDGRRDEDEKLLSGILVSLVDENGEPAKDIFGKKVEAVCTAEDGSYLFENLAQGTWQVVFNGDKTDISSWKVTKKKADRVEETRNSDADGVYEKGILKSAKISGLSLLSLEEIVEQGIGKQKITHQDAGFYEEQPEEPEDPSEPEETESTEEESETESTEKETETEGTKEESETEGTKDPSEPESPHNPGRAKGSAASEITQPVGGEESIAAQGQQRAPLAATGEDMPVAEVLITLAAAAGTVGYLLLRRRKSKK